MPERLAAQSAEGDSYRWGAVTTNRREARGAGKGESKPQRVPEWSRAAAEAMFDKVTSMNSSPCAEGQQLAPSLYRVIDIAPIETATRSDSVSEAA